MLNDAMLNDIDSRFDTNELQAETMKIIQICENENNRNDKTELRKDFKRKVNGSNL